MRTRQFKKFSHSLLNQKIPENLLPFSGLSLKKGERSKTNKQASKTPMTKKFGLNLDNQLYKSFALPLIENTGSPDRLPFNTIYSIDQINLELRKNRIQKSSDFGYQLQERKKLRWFYGGISTRRLRKLFKDSYTKDLTLTSSVFQNLEKRLDIVLLRSGLFGSVYETRQWILNRRIYVNDRPISRPSYGMQPGDIVTIQEKWHPLLIQNILERFLLFLKNTQLTANVNKGSFPNIQNIKMENPLDVVAVDNKGEMSIKGIKNHFNSLLCLQTSRKFQKNLNNSIMFRAFNVMKAPNLEISYKTLSFIYLYPPQKIVFPTLLNIPAIEKSF